MADQVNTGQRAYAAFCAASGGKAADGSALPTWEQLDDAHRDGWRAAEAIVPSKPWFVSRTVWVNLTAFVAAMVAAAEPVLPSLQGQLPEHLFAYIAFLLPVVNAALRFITSGKLGGGKPDA